MQHLRRWAGLAILIVALASCSIITIEGDGNRVETQRAVIDADTTTTIRKKTPTK